MELQLEREWNTNGTHLGTHTFSVRLFLSSTVLHLEVNQPHTRHIKIITQQRD